MRQFFWNLLILWMSNAVMEKERFTMLLLEPGEIFFEDYSVQMTLQDPANPEKQVWSDGRLKLCSKSLVFVDKDINKPLIKVQLKETKAITKYNSLDIPPGENDVLSVDCKQYVEMLEGNTLAPYKFIHKNINFLFSFNYAKVDDCLPQILQLLRASSLPMAEQNAMITVIVHSRQSRFSFDTSWLENLYEKKVFEVQANKVLPLVINPGRVLLTTSRVYFQPYNNMDQYPVLKVNLKDIKSVTKRRFLLRQVALEIKYIRQSEKKVAHLFLSMKGQEDRDAFYNNLLNQPELSLDTIAQNQMTIQWQNGALSNYDYLLYVNSLADRTFHDLTQYPVMPWILQDYTSENLDLNDPEIYRDLSKPIGALGAERLIKLKERFVEMGEPKFLYGSHYSAPGLVLFFLARKYPQYMLCLQNGRFDHPDRMFNNMVDVWKNVLVNMTDLKELIPEFYDPSNGGDFLVNSYGIDFGYRHDGAKVSDVQLPPWAKGPADFIQTLRNALESNWVSQNLHHWIDLIFGYKQKGEEAKKADNVFFHLCYEGAIDLDTIKDLNDRHALEVQIMEFGQIPKQVFHLPHPQRLVTSTDLVYQSSLLSMEKIAIKDERAQCKLEQIASFHSHKCAINYTVFVNPMENCDNIISVGHDGTARFYSMKTRKSTRSVVLSPLPLSSCITYQSSPGNNVLVVGSWDNSLILYDVEFGKVINNLRAHDDAVSCVVFSPSREFVISGSWDCTVKIWKCHDSRANMKPSKNLVAQLSHESKVTALAISKDETLLVSGTEDGEIFVWNMELEVCRNFSSYELQFTVKGHAGKINGIVFEPESQNIVTCAGDKIINVIDVRTNTLIFFANAENEPISLAWSGSFLLVGDSLGNITIWDFKAVVLIFSLKCHEGSVNSITVSPDNKQIVSGGSDKKLLVWNCR